MRVAPRVVVLPPGARCVADPRVVLAVRARDSDPRSVRDLARLQLLVAGFQCAKGLPVTGAVDAATLGALGA